MCLSGTLNGLRRAVVLATVTLALSAPSGAWAAHTVTVHECGQNANNAFAPIGNAPTQFESFCPGSPGVLFAGVVGPYAAQTFGGYEVSAPAGTSFLYLTLNADTSVGDGSDGSQFIVDGVNTASQFERLFVCGYSQIACSADQIHVTPSSLLEFHVILYCARWSGCPSSPGPSLHIDDATLVIEDENPPAIASKAGPVWTQGIWHHATDILGGAIGNGAEGIGNVTATLDGVATPVNPSCDYTQLRVCPDATLSTPLNGATDGSHHLTINATTAPGITATLYDDPNYLVDSNPPTAPLNVTLDSPGSAYSPAPNRNLTWTNPSGQVAPITHAVIHVCRVDSGQCRDQTADGSDVQQATITPWAGGGVYRLTVALEDAAGNINDTPGGGQSAPVILRYDQRPPSTLVASVRPFRTNCHRAAPHRHRPHACSVRAIPGRSIQRVGFRRPTTIYASLSDAAGHPLAQAALLISQRVRGRSTFSSVASATTDAAGQLRYRVSPGPSRILRLAYPGSDALKPAFADIDLRVPAYSTFHTNRGVAHIGQPITFSGRLLGGYIPPGGKSIQLEGVDRGQLVPVSRDLHTDPSGRWRFTYAFHYQVGSIYTYPFRLSIPADPFYAYLGSATHALGVTILNP